MCSTDQRLDWSVAEAINVGAEEKPWNCSSPQGIQATRVKTMWLSETLLYIENAGQLIRAVWAGWGLSQGYRSPWQVTRKSQGTFIPNTLAPSVPCAQKDTWHHSLWLWKDLLDLAASIGSWIKIFRSGLFFQPTRELLFLRKAVFSLFNKLFEVNCPTSLHSYLCQEGCVRAGVCLTVTKIIQS